MSCELSHQALVSPGFLPIFGVSAVVIDPRHEGNQHNREKSLKKILFGTGLVMFGAVLTIVGCGGSTPETQGGDNQSPSSEEVKLGETPETSGKSGDEKTGVSCSYVQYCQAPGYYGTVCIYTSGCDADTSYAECLREVRALCGTPPVYPADPFYHQ